MDAKEILRLLVQNRFWIAVGIAAQLPIIGYVVTVAVSYLHLPVAMAVAVALLVATVKGSLVACYFMHLISEKKLIYAVLALTIVFFVVLMALPVLTHENGLWIHE